MSWTNGLYRAVGQDVDVPVPTFYSGSVQVQVTLARWDGIF